MTKRRATLLLLLGWLYYLVAREKELSLLRNEVQACSTVFQDIASRLVMCRSINEQCCR